MVPIEGEEYLLEPIGKHHAGDLLSPTVSRTGFDSRNNRIFNISYPFPKLGLIEKIKATKHMVLWYFYEWRTASQQTSTNVPDIFSELSWEPVPEYY